jgi:hypothetical protein
MYERERERARPREDETEARALAAVVGSTDDRQAAGFFDVDPSILGLCTGNVCSSRNSIGALWSS